MAESVERGDSFDGSFEYHSRGVDDDFDVIAVWRVGNSEGQGGCVVCGDPEAATSYPPAKAWAEVPLCIESRPAEYTTVVYGISRAIAGNEVIIDCDGHGDVTMVKLTFNDSSKAWAAYCKGFRIEAKVVEHPEHELKP